MNDKNKKNWIRSDIIIPILTALLGAAVPELFRHFNKQVKPKANFEYYSEQTDKKYAFSLKPVKFRSTSKDASYVKWTFPSGKVYQDDSVETTFEFSGRHDVKLEAFSEDGLLSDSIIIECLVLPDFPDKLTSVYIENLPSKPIFGNNPILFIGTVGGDKLPAGQTITFNGIPPGITEYFFQGNGYYVQNSNSMPNSCYLNGHGKVDIVPNANYKIQWRDERKCELELIKLD
ncbi:MAG TPA: hypothetical protein VGN64_07035 [Dyadobacter sp.]|jgi:hypothetical protein|nr:hypothetical protein [Dyadobacter sp.]